VFEEFEDEEDARGGGLAGVERGLAGEGGGRVLFDLGGIVADNDFAELDNVAVVAIFEDLDLPEPGDGEAAAVFGVDLESLERHHFSRVALLCAGYPAVGALLDVVELVVVLDAPALAKGPAFET